MRQAGDGVTLCWWRPRGKRRGTMRRSWQGRGHMIRKEFRLCTDVINMTFRRFMTTKCTHCHIMSEPEPAWQSEPINMYRIGNPTQLKAGVPLHGRQFCGHFLSPMPQKKTASAVPSDKLTHVWCAFQGGTQGHWSICRLRNPLFKGNQIHNGTLVCFHIGKM